MNDLAVLRFDRLSIPVERRSAFATAAERCAEALFAMAVREEDDLVVLSTCERFEVYHRRSRAPVGIALGSHLMLAGVRGTVVGNPLRHLFRVAAGVESRIPLEPHVLGQVRGALELALARGTAHGVTTTAFRGAVACGRRVRAMAAFDVEQRGYAGVAVHRLQSELGILHDRRILIVGTGALAAEVARSLRGAGVAGITIAGRHQRNAERLAREVGARGLTLTSLLSEPSRFDAIVTAVSAVEPVVTAETLGRCRTGLLIDFGVSPNVSVEVDALPGVRVFRLDELGMADAFAGALARATEVVEGEVRRAEAAQGAQTARGREVPDDARCQRAQTAEGREVPDDARCQRAQTANGREVPDDARCQRARNAKRRELVAIVKRRNA